MKYDKTNPFGDLPDATNDPFSDIPFDNDRSAGQIVGDAALGLTKGAMSANKMLADTGRLAGNALTADFDKPEFQDRMISSPVPGHATIGALSKGLNWLSNQSDEGLKAASEMQSREYQRESSNKIYDDETGEWNAPSVAQTAGLITENVGQIPMMIAGGGGLANTFKFAGKAAPYLGYGAAGAGVTSGDTFSEAKEEVKALLESQENDYSPDQIDTISSELAVQAAAKQLPVSFVLSAAGLGIPGSKPFKSRLANAATGLFTEGASEALEEGMQGYNINTAKQSAGADVNNMSGVFNRAATGFIAGAPTGGVLGGLQRPTMDSSSQVDLTKPAQSPAEEVADYNPEIQPSQASETDYDIPTVARNSSSEGGLNKFATQFVDEANQRMAQQMRESGQIQTIDGQYPQDWEPNWQFGQNDMPYRGQVAPYTYQGELLDPEKASPVSVPLGNTLESPVIDGEFEQQRALPDKIFAGDEQELNYQINGKPFAGKKAISISKGFKRAKNEGLAPEIIQVNGGYAWRVNDGKLDTGGAGQQGDQQARGVGITQLDSQQPDLSRVMPGNNISATTEGNGYLGNETIPVADGRNADGDAVDIDIVANDAATSPLNDIPEPTAAQKEAGNYKKGHIKLHGMDIAIENPKGSKRSGVDESGKAWSNKINHHYGYVKRTEGADGDHIDVFIGDKPESQKVFVVDQVNPKTGKFDEVKAMLGFDSIDDAKAGYLSNYDKNWKGLNEITETTVGEFKAWTQKPRKSKRPFASKKDSTQVTSNEAGLGAPIKSTNSEQATKGVSHVSDTVSTDKEVTAKPASNNYKPKQVSKGNGYLFDFDPEVLIATETDNKNLDSYVGDPRKPIAVTKRGGDYVILDGHHRTGLAAKNKEKVRAVIIPEEAVAKMKAKGIHQADMLGEWIATGQHKSNSIVVDDNENPILTQSKSKWINQQLAKDKIKRTSPGYDAAKAKIEAQYEDELDKAYAELPFERYNELNSDTPENINRSAYKALTGLRFNRTTPVTGSGVTEKSAKLAFNKFIKQFKGLDDAGFKQVITDKKPSEVFKGANLNASDDLAIKGAFDKDTNRLYIFTQNHSSIDDIRATLREELLTHKGLGVFEPQEIGRIISLINETRNSTNPKVKAIWADIDKNYTNSPELVQAEEFLGKVSQEKPKLIGKYWNNLITKLTTLMRKIGLVRDGITVPEMRSVVYEIGDRLRAGKAASNYGFNTQEAADSGLFFNKENLSPNKEEAESYRKELARSLSSSKSNVANIKLGKTPKVLTALGSPELNLFISRDTVRKATNGVKHNVDISTIENLPEHLADPVAVFRSKSQGKVVLIDAFDSQRRPVIVAIHFDKKGGRDLQINQIASVYGRNNAENALKNFELEYINESKNPALVRLIGLQLPKSGSPSRGSVGNVLTKDDLVKENPDIRFNRSAPEQPFTIDKEKWYEHAQRFVQDKFNRVKIAQDTVNKAGIKTSDASDVHGIESLYYGKVEEDFRLLTEQYLEPIANKLASAGVPQKELDLYMYALHAKERNAYIRTIDENMDAGSGMTDTEADSIIAAVKSDPRRKAFYDMRDMVRKMIDERVDKMKDQGLIDEDEFNALQSSYENYVPLKGQAKDEGGKPKGTGMGFNIKGRESIAALGRKSKAESPLLHAFIDTQKAIIRGHKNAVGNAMLNLVEEAPNPELWNIYTTEGPMERKKGSDGKVVHKPMSADKMSGLASNPLSEWFATKKDGITHYIKFEDPLIAKQLKNVGVDNGNWITQKLGMVNRYLSTVATSANPEFLVTNAVRDIQTALYNVLGEASIDGGRLTEVKAGELSIEILKGIPGAMNGIRKALRDNDLSSDWAKEFEKFRKAGAKTGYFDMKDLETQSKDLEKMMLLNGGKKPIASTFKKALKFIDDYNTAVENAVRLSTFKNAIDAGLTEQQAAVLAKNLTVNFNRKGEAGTWLNSLYLFANAGIQGTANFARAIAHNPIKGGKLKLNLAQKAGVVMAGIAYGLAAMGRLIADDDEDGVSYWEKVPAHVKERNFVIMTGGKDYITIPMPYGYNIFANFGTATESVLNGGDKSDNAGFLVKAILGSFLPLGLSEGGDATETALKTITPQIGKPLVDIATNTNFFGSRIYNNANEVYGDKRSDSASGYTKTHGSFKAVAMGLNNLTGGSNYQEGVIDVHPETIRYMVEYLTGGTGRFSLNVGETAERALKGEFEKTKTPFVRRLAGEINEYGDMDTYRERIDKVLSVEAEFKSLRGSEKLQFRKENVSSLRLVTMAREYEKEIKKLRKQRNNFIDRGMSNAVERVEQQINRKIDIFNRRYNQIVGD